MVATNLRGKVTAGRRSKNRSPGNPSRKISAIKVAMSPQIAATVEVAKTPMAVIVGPDSSQVVKIIVDMVTLTLTNRCKILTKDSHRNNRSPASIPTTRQAKSVAWM